jgi:heptosyltransferase-2
MAREYVDLLAPLGCADDGLGLELAADPGVAATIRARLDPLRPCVGIAPGAAFGPSKLWPPDRYAQVADALTARLNAQCVLLTGPGEEATRDAVLSAAKSGFVSLDGAGHGIRRLKAAVSLLDLLICNDSGARHVAVAFHVPTICIMGPTSPAYSNGPHERGKVLRVDVDCGPCQKPVCTTDHRCMTRILPEEVIETALDILERTRRT